jgi:hypothetical protein
VTDDEELLLNEELSYAIEMASLELLLVKYGHVKLKGSALCNIILSAHLASMFNMLSEITKGHPTAREKVEEFIEDLTKFLENKGIINPGDVHKFN